MGEGLIGDMMGNAMTQFGTNVAIQYAQKIEDPKKSICLRDAFFSAGVAGLNSLFSYPMTINNPQAKMWATESAKVLLTPGWYVDNIQSYTFSQIDKRSGGCK